VAEYFQLLCASTTFKEESACLHTAHWGAEVQPESMALDLTHQPDLAQTIVVTCALQNIKFRISGLQSLKIKETDRMAALICEMKKLGYVLHEAEGSILYWNGERCERSHEAIDTYEDHRMAMAFAPACLVMPDVCINNPHVVTKSYPHYWDDLKAAGFIIEEV
jgi:3-phosphoshikimate 1-carboxyvinyltransferase